MKRPGHVVRVDRKTARKRAREEKKQRKALNYTQRKKKEKDEKRQEWLERNPKVLEKIRAAQRERNETKAAPVAKKAAGGRKKPRVLNAEAVSADPLLAFAERAIDEGILGSDGEFDEGRMNGLFAGDGDSDDENKENEEMSIGSDEEEYLMGDNSSEEQGGTDSETEASAYGVSDDESTPESNGELAKSTSSLKKVNKDKDAVRERQTFGAASVVTPAATENVLKLQKIINGFINKLSMSNFESIASSIVDLFRSHSRHDITESLTSSILSSITKQPNLLDSFIMTYSSLVSAMAHMVGIDFVACVLEKCVHTLDEQKLKYRLSTAPQYTSIPSQEDPDQISPSRIFVNCITLLAYLYNLQVLADVLILDIIEESTVSLGELDVEVLVKLIRSCGAQLRRDDPAALKQIVIKIESRVAQTPASQQSSRFKFMLETIQDLKSNRQKLVAVQLGDLESAKKILRNILQESGRAKLEPLRVTLTDIRSIKTKGKWWQIGGVWNPDGAAPSEGKISAASVGEPGRDSTISSLARKQRMNTDLRRTIFTTLVTSEDFLDAHQRLLSLKLTNRQEREVAHVLIHCCCREKAYNPFYALVAGRFLEMQHNFLVTFKYAFWDRLRQMEADELKLQEIIHIAKFYGFLLGRASLPITILKRASLTHLTETGIVFFQALLGMLLETAKDSAALAAIFEELNKDATTRRGRDKRTIDRLFGPSDGEDDGDEGENQAVKEQEVQNLRLGLRIFLKQFVRGNKDLKLLSKPEIIRTRIDKVLQVLD